MVGPKEYIVSDAMTDLWMDEFVIPRGHCSVCGNYGIVDTRGRVFTPAGHECGIRAFCMCPNGRSMKGLCSDIDEFKRQSPTNTAVEQKLVTMLIAERKRYLLAMDAAYPDVGFGLVPMVAEREAIQQIEAELGKVLMKGQ